MIGIAITRDFGITILTLKILNSFFKFSSHEAILAYFSISKLTPLGSLALPFIGDKLHKLALFWGIRSIFLHLPAK